MEHNDKSDSKERGPGWLWALAWSLMGIFGAILTICILTSSLLWLIRWADLGQTGTDFPQTRHATVTITAADAAATATALALAQTTASDTIQSTGTPVAPSPGAVQTPPAAATADQTAVTSDSASTANSANATQTAQAAASASAAGSSSAGSTAAADSSTASTDSPSAGSTASTDSSDTASASATDAASEQTDTPTSTSMPTFTPVPTPTDTPTPTPTPIALDPQEYVVQRDDWLSKLSDKFYGDIFAYPAIVVATNAKSAEDDSFAFITDPDVIEIGQKLWIPTAEEAAAILAELEAEEPTSP